MTKRRGFGDLKPRLGNADNIRLDDLLDIYSLPKDTWVTLRFIEGDGDFLPVKRHWVKIYAGKEKKETKVPRFCVAFDPDNESVPLAGVHCPYCDLSTGKDGSSNYENFYLVNAIVRELQEEEPSRKVKHTPEEIASGYKDHRSKSWTPVRVIRIPSSVASRLQELGETNLVKNSKTGEKRAFDMSHTKYGCDINIKYKPDKKGTDKYSVDKSENGRTPLNEEELAYLKWSLKPEILDIAGRMSPQQAAEDFKRMEIVGADVIDEDDEDDEDLDLSSRKKKAKATKSRRAAFDEDDEDEDEPPVKKPSKKKPVDEDDEDDDDEPPRKSKPSRKKPVDEDDEDDDEPPRKSKPVKGRRAAFDEDDEDEDEPPVKKPSRKKPVDEDDEDEDDAPPRKSKPAKKKSWEDEEDDWDA